MSDLQQLFAQIEWLSGEDMITDKITAGSARSQSRGFLTVAEAMRCPEVKALVEALHYYADFYENPNDGPWGILSDDYGYVAKQAIAKLNLNEEE